MATTTENCLRTPISEKINNEINGYNNITFILKKLDENNKIQELQ